MKNCRSCDCKDMIDVLSLGEQYLADFRTDNVRPPKHSLEMVVCPDCHLAQLKDTTPPDLMYNNSYGYESGINGIVRADLEEIATIGSKMVDLQDGDVVLDIGCNDGTLLSNYTKLGHKVWKVGVDPVPKFEEKALQHADVVGSTYFTADVYDGLAQFGRGDFRSKLITSISMFYDLDDPNAFVADVKKCLRPDGVWIIQQNYLGAMLTRTAYCNIVHEHLEYYSLLSLENLLARHDLDIFSVQQNTINGGSFRTFVCHRGARFAESSLFYLRGLEEKQKLHTLEPYQAFADNVNTQSEKLHDLIAQLNESGKSVYIYGASTRGNTLLQKSRLTKELLPFAVERNPDKWGKKIASLQIPIISEEEARNRKPDYMLVLPWFFFDEFKHREKDYVNGGGKFILPLPEVCIYPGLDNL